ncbi:MAG: hypothetical protein JSS67_00180 [Bacteroidetes bacterium]|nr:hypothetical protein [Bacteroidota bacterium]
MKRKFFLLSLFSSVLLLFGLGGCQKEYSLENGILDSPATGSLTDSLGFCLGDSVYGTYYNGITPGSDTCFVDIKVNVLTPGTYSIKSNLQNGFLFADSGYFNSTGITTVRLRPLGTPIIQVATDFLVTFDSSTCGFTVMINDSTGHSIPTGGDLDLALSDSAWTFMQGASTFVGPVDTAFLMDTLTLKVLSVNGYTAATGDSALNIGMFLPVGTITPGTYPTSTSGYFYFIDNANPTVPVYSADPSTIGFVVTINILSYDDVLHVVAGNFSGTARDASGNPVNITGGKFTALVE